ncbi:enoyl-CoA hydratase/isomerase family protein [Amycolatopsis pigmentata]|uniref:Enoyl-CoA hydratase/isomerase family protein n=1 Tax=Amycolatopsis pigmentata TaxID=450801 RepID=A0ABW5G4Q1_9PSEU
MTIRNDPIVDGVARITLNRPETGNALDLSTARAFRRAIVETARNEQVRVLVLAATGKLFCGGGDVGEMAASADRSGYLAELAGTMHEALDALRRTPVPVIAQVQGTAAGAGVGLVLAADIAVAADPAKFAIAYPGVGLSPDCGVSALLPRVVGPRRAAVFALTGRVLTAVEAEEWGLVTEVCSAERLPGRVDELAGAIAAGPAPALGQAAILLRQGIEESHVDQLRREAVTIAGLGAGREAKERIAAFVSTHR